MIYKVKNKEEAYKFYQRDDILWRFGLSHHPYSPRDTGPKDNRNLFDMWYSCLYKELDLYVINLSAHEVIELTKDDI